MRGRRWMFVWGLLVAAGAVATGAYASRSPWREWLHTRSVIQPTEVEPHDDHDRTHAHHEHASKFPELHLSAQALANLGLKLGEVALSSYTSHLVVPGEVTEYSGHSCRHITPAFPGIVSKVHVLAGQAVKPGDALLSIEPLGDGLTSAQTALLKTIEDLNLVELELKRIGPLVETGTLPARTRIEKEYEQKRLSALQQAQTQELLVRGLSRAEVDHIISERALVREFTLYVPYPADAAPPTPQAEAPLSAESPGEASGQHQHDSSTVYTVDRLQVFPGKLVQPGDELCDLGHHSLLNIVGHAFERDAQIVAEALQQQWPVTALFEGSAASDTVREGLKIRYIEGTLDSTARTLDFHLGLTNEVLRDVVGDRGVVYRTWRFKPGQKVRLLLPVAQLRDQIVLPADAVATEGPEAYVFRRRHDAFERVPVVITHRDSRQVVVRQGDHLAPGNVIAMNNGYQLFLALRRAETGAIPLHEHDH